MRYELDDLDRVLLTVCRQAMKSNSISSLDEDDIREAVKLLLKLTTYKPPRWPYRYRYIINMGYVVWQDVFEGQEMPYSLDEAAQKLRLAVFVIENEAADYCRYINSGGI